MGTVYYKDRYGLTQGFEIAGNEPTASEQARISASLSGEQMPEEKPNAWDEKGILGALGPGIAAGYNQAQAGLMGIGGLLARNAKGGPLASPGHFLGFNAAEYEKMRNEQNEEAKTYAGPEGALADQKSLYDKAKYVSYQFGNSIPSSAAGIGGAILGSAVGPGGTLGGFALGAGLAGAASLPQQFNENLETQVAEHGYVKDEGKAFRAALVQSGIEGVADRALLGLSGALGPVIPNSVRNIVQDATKGALATAAKKVGTNVAAGFTTEATTEAVQQAITRWQAEQPLGDEAAQKEYLESAIVGGLLGGTMGGMLGTAGAVQDHRATRLRETIQKDLDAEFDSQYGTNVEGNVAANRQARMKQAEHELAAEEELAGPNQALLSDLRSEQTLLNGPKTFNKEVPSPATEAGQVDPMTSGSASAKRPASTLFSEDEYNSAVEAMRGETLVSADKIKNRMKIGRKKADAIFDEMLGRADGTKAGSKGQYLTVVDKSTTGNVGTEGKVTRTYEVRPIAKEDATPFRVIRQGGKQIGPEFKTSEEAHTFAEKQNLGDYAVTEVTEPKNYGVYEVTSGVQGQKPVSRFVRGYTDNQSALDYANSLNPAVSPKTNERVAETQRQKDIRSKANEMMGRYQANAQALADTILGKGRSIVELVESIKDPTGNGVLIEGLTDNNLINGLRRIQIAHGINNPNLSPDEFQNAINSVASHEVLHVARASGLFTPQEWRALENRANTRINGKNYTYLERAQVRTKDAPEGASLTEEAIAEMVRDYMRDPAAFKQDTRGLLRRFLDFVRTLGGYMADVDAGNNVLDDLASGRLAERGQVTREQMYGPYYSSVKIPGFYLKSAEFFENIAERNPDQSHSGQQWLGMLTNNKAGIKKDELLWLGLEDWLKGQDKVSARRILEFIGANSIDIHENIGDMPYNESANYAINQKIRQLQLDLEEFPLAQEEREDINRQIKNLMDDKQRLKDRRTYHGDTSQAGGSDYTEMVFHMPHLEPQFNEPFHYDGFPNIIASARFKTRTIDGKKTLFIEEMQSDLHQKGRKKGYVSKGDVEKLKSLQNELLQVEMERRGFGDVNWTDMSPQEQARWNDLTRQKDMITGEITDLERIMEIPEAPFKTSWHEFVAKRLVRHAAENGFDAITWNAEPEGVRQTEHYPNLRTTISEDGTETHEVVQDEGWDDNPDMVQNVTGIVNFYTKRLAKDFKKLFGKEEFGSPNPTIVPKKENDGASIDPFEIFPTEDDFMMVMNELASNTDDKAWKNSLRKAAQIVRNQRQYDPQAAIDAANLGNRWIDDFNEAFPEYAIEDQGTDTFDANGNPNLDRWWMDVTPELKDTALGKGFPMFSSVKRGPVAPDTPEFKRWFGASKVVGSDGKPLVVYHGTTNDFESFNKDFTNPMSAVGQGFYFTNETEDANVNYADPQGPDVLARMQDETDRLLAEGATIEELDIDEDGVAASVKDRFLQNEGAVIPAFLSIKNPFVMDGRNSTVVSPRTIARMKDGVPAIEGDFLNVFPKWINHDLDQMVAKKPEGVSAEYLFNVLTKNAGLMDAIDPASGMEASREVMRRIVEAGGYDGIIMKNVAERWPMFDGMTKDTVHYIAFQPEQVKSPYNNGEFNPADSRILYSAVRPSYAAAGAMGQRTPRNAPAKTLADVEAAITYNTIAPSLERLMGKIGVSKPRAQSIAEGTIIALQDKMQPLAKLIDRVRANGGMISNESDAYLREQLMSGWVDTTIQQHDKELYQPLFKAVHNLNVTQADVDELLKRHPSNMMTDARGISREMSAVRNILQNYKNPKMAMAELYLYAQHAKERNIVMRDRNSELIGTRTQQYDSGSGMSDFEADDVLLWIGTKPFAKQLMDLGNPNSIRSLFRKIIASTNDVRVKSGLTPDFRNMFDAQGNPLEKYQDYAPLRGYTDENPDADHDELTKAFARAGKGFKVMGKEDQSAVGRASEASNLIANAVLQNEEAIVRAGKNRVGQSFLHMLEDNMGITLPNGPNSVPNIMSDFAEIIPLAQKKPVFDKKSGKVRMSVDNKRMDPNVMVVKRDGQEIGIKLNDPKLRNAFLEGSTLGNTGQGSLIKGLLTLNRFLAAVRTSYNPEFMISNFLRDLGAATLNLTEYDMKGLRTQVAKDALPAIRGVYRSLRDGKPDAWRNEFEEFAARGGKTAFMGIRDLEGTINRITKELEGEHDGSLQMAWDKVKSVRELVEAGNDAVENGIRVATYKHLKDRLAALSKNPNDPKEMDRIRDRAAYAAKNLTVNFNMGGTKKPFMQALYLFFNASLQGSAALINPLIRSKKVRQFWLTAIAAGALQDVLLSALSPIADDGEKEYDKIPETVLQTNIIMFNPFSDRGYIKIPMPYLFNAAWNAGRAMMRTARGGYSLGEGMSSIAGTAVDAFNPWGGGGTWFNYVAPTIMDPMVDLVANTNFMGAPISPPENPYGVDEPNAQRYWNNTSPAYVGVAQLLDKVTGGDGVFPGAVSYSPNQYEYAFEWLFGGALSTVVRSFDFLVPEALGGAGRAADLITGGEVSTNDIPFVRRFLGNITSREDLSGYIEKKDDIMRVRTALRQAAKSGDSEAYQRIMQTYPTEYRMASKINAIETRRKKIGQQIKKIREAKGLSDAEKKKLVEPLKKQQEALVNQANALMNG